MVATSLFIFAMVTFALGVGAWVKIPYHAISYTLAYIMPSILFTGAIFFAVGLAGLKFGGRENAEDNAARNAPAD